MSENIRTPFKQFAEIGDVHRSGESASESEENLRPFSQAATCDGIV